MHYREKLWPSFGVWMLVPLIGFMCAVAVAPIAPEVSLITAITVTIALALWAAAAATKIEVTDEHLLCGDAKLPISVISGGALIAEPDVRRQMGPDLDARAFVTVRGWVPTMVRLTLEDPEDDTPYWLVSTRRPEELLAALQKVHPGEVTWAIHDESADKESAPGKDGVPGKDGASVKGEKPGEGSSDATTNDNA